MQNEVVEIRRLFAYGREACEHYHGIKFDQDESQCTHPDNKRAGSWCALDCCPLLRED